MLTDAVDITVIDFDTEVRAARYSQAEFARLIERIRQKRVSGNTAIYDAVGVYLDGAAGQDGRKIMLLYTDGGDTGSSLPLHELIDLLKTSDAKARAKAQSARAAIAAFKALGGGWQAAAAEGAKS